ncbi:MAG: hypothetical protein AAF363_20015 [Bacteroidota bacterium]
MNGTFNFLIGFGKSRFGEGEDLEANILDIRANITPGITYFLNSKLALNANVGQLRYNRRRERLDIDSEPENLDQDYGVSFDLNTFSLGLQYFLRNGSD